MQPNSEYIRLAADLQSDSIVDGPGLRTVIWTQGCAHHCEGCQNPQTWDFEGGGLVPIDMVLSAIDELEYQKGITFSGGDPMYQPEACNKIAEYAIKKGYDIWVYTGFTYEELIEKGSKDIMDFLSEIDVLIDGKFEIKNKSLDLKYRGSSNQRIIDVPKSLKGKKVVLKVLDEDKKCIKKETIYI